MSFREPLPAPSVPSYPFRLSVPKPLNLLTRRAHSPSVTSNIYPLRNQWRTNGEETGPLFRVAHAFSGGWGGGGGGWSCLGSRRF